jgi:hypothetical protein
MQMSLLEKQEKKKALEINKCLSFIPNITPSKVALGIIETFRFAQGIL